MLSDTQALLLQKSEKQKERLGLDSLFKILTQSRRSDKTVVL